MIIYNTVGQADSLRSEDKYSWSVAEIIEKNPQYKHFEIEKIGDDKWIVKAGIVSESPKIIEIIPEIPIAKPKVEIKPEKGEVDAGHILGSSKKVSAWKFPKGSKSAKRTNNSA